jgi:hypothetical protein
MLVLNCYLPQLPSAFIKLVNLIQQANLIILVYFHDENNDYIWFEDSPRTEDIEQSEFIDIFYSNNRSIFSCQEPHERTEENGRSKC